MTVKLVLFLSTYQLTSTYPLRPVACFCLKKKIVKVNIKANEKTFVAPFLTTKSYKLRLF